MQSAGDHLRMAVLEPGPCILVICVTYILMGLVIADMVLCVGGVVGLLVLKQWTSGAVKKTETKSDKVTSNSVTQSMRKTSQCDIVNINSDLMTSGNKVVNPARRNLSFD